MPGVVLQRAVENIVKPELQGQGNVSILPPAEGSGNSSFFCLFVFVSSSIKKKVSPFRSKINVNMEDDLLCPRIYRAFLVCLVLVQGKR